MPLSDALVHSAFIEYVAQNKKEKRIRYRHCQKDSTKHISRQRDHLIKCKSYLKTMKEQEKHNSITRKAVGMVDESQQPLINNQLFSHKRKQLDKLIAMVIYYEGRSLGLYEDEAMKEFFVNGIGYTSPSRDRISETLLDEAYLDTQEQVKRLLNETSLLNFVSDESNNQPGDRILNMCVMVKG
ncbi:MAG: hypothetical protein ALECFALPRED_004749 [Alectoria fallacina]|uniref:Uncharacterized protein n=1 Tax=Alectoria fallacina TaxID=1903189 RepID=A0A8H3FRH5_9LECA|nr:MAG: hypothetical protein ALECFALPRED_004749 [Alectoria fallacina]